LDRVISFRVTGRRLVVALVCCVLVGLAVLGWRSLEDVRTAYAVWNVADAVISHLDRTGEWPRDWGDLKDDVERLWRDSQGKIFERLKATVEVEFVADVERMRAHPRWGVDDEPGFRVIRARSGSRAHYVEPNLRVWMYLNGRMKAP
jgi:hypothetical protein